MRIERILNCVKRSYTINGRVSRLRYWKNTLYVGILQIAILWSLVLLGTAGFSSLVLMPIAVLTAAATLLYLVTVAIRRLHDRNKGAIVWLAYLIVPNAVGFMGKTAEAPILNALAGLMALWVIVDLGFLAGTRGDNAYGADPRDAEPRTPSLATSTRSTSLSTP